MLSLATVPVGVPVHIRDDLLLRQRLSLTATLSQCADDLVGGPLQLHSCCTEHCNAAMGAPRCLALQQGSDRGGGGKSTGQGQHRAACGEQGAFFLVASARVLFLGRFFSWVLFWVLFNKAPGCFIGVCEKAPDIGCFFT